MRLFLAHLRSEMVRCRDEGVRVSVVGRRDRLGPDLLAAIESIEARTHQGRALHLQLAVDYSGRDAILSAARLYRDTRPCPPTEASALGAVGPLPTLPPEAFSRLIARAIHAGSPVPAVDLLIRPGGEQRLSDFLLWECAYAELVFTPCLWPDFGEDELERALADFRRRHRRFGGLSPDTADGSPRETLPAAPVSPSPSSPVNPGDVRDRGARAHG